MFNRMMLPAAVCRAGAFLVAALSVSAAPISTLYNTGVDDTGALLDAQATDPHYTLTSSPDPGAPGPDATTLKPGFPVPPWLDEGPSSRWIAPQPNQGVGSAPGTYVYTTYFDLTGFDPTTATITGQFSADDNLTAIRLNGTSLGVSAGGFNAWHPFTIPVGGAFVDGINTLEFDVVNGGTAVNPAGFRVEMTGRAVGANEKPSILTQPASQTADEGDTVIFSVEAIGSPTLTYEWLLNGKTIPGAQDPSLTLHNVTGDSAGKYSVKVANGAGDVTSAEAVLTVLKPFPGIYNTGVGDDHNVLADDAVDPHYKLVPNPQDPSVTDPLAMSSIPSPPWIANSILSRWIGPVPNSSAAPGLYTYQLKLDLTGYDPATAFVAGRWASDDGGAIFLNGADTGVRSAGFGGWVEFNIKSGFVTGVNILEFQVTNGGVSANPTGLRVENLHGTADKRIIQTVPAHIVTQPRGGTNIITSTRTLTVVADGDAPITYQWYRGSEKLDGQTTSRLEFPSIHLTDAGRYHVRVSNALATVDSDEVRIYVIQPQLGLYNTGVNEHGAGLADNQPDPHYLLVASPDATYAGPWAYAATGLPSPPWVVNDPSSRWITPRPSASEAAPGTYQYRLFFTLQADEVGTAAITADVATDDGNGGIYLNGAKVPFGASGFGGYTSLNIPEGSPFVEGINTLDFLIVNGGDSANPTGLRVNNLVLTGAIMPPALDIAATDAGIQVSWSASADGFVLQETSSLEGPWADSTATVSSDGVVNSILVSPAVGARFYRLRH
jgi:hypothetical protein